MSSILYKKHNYTNKNINYIKNSFIYEFDMYNAGLSILYHNNVFTKKEFDELNNLDKLTKNIKVGKFLRKNSDINIALMDEFIKIRKYLFKINNIEDSDILSIKKDAVFLINKDITNLKLNDDYIFRKKNTYNSYINILGKEFYYSPIKNDIKGFSDNIKNIQKNYLFKKIFDILKLDNSFQNEEVFKELLELKYNFVTRNLEKEYYYDIINNGYVFKLSNNYFIRNDIDNSLIQYCEISNNLNFIINFISILLS